MECIRISDSKIKLTLGPDEVEKYDFEPVKNGEERTGGSFLSGFRRILRDVRRDTGFDAGGKRVLVRYFYGKDGGCEMYITKLRDLSRGDGVKNLNGAYLWGGSPALSRGEGAEKSVFRFFDLSSLVACCRLLKRVGFNGASEAFADRRRSVFYLALSEGHPSVPEYGVPCPKGSYFFILEHFERFSTDAVGRLGRL
ncbi:MAG: hypothetical protein IKN50_00175 [Clostridia bacterium]|nr:hypothetical protein [Clostridia bacterium]MBR3639002.1 hypothetical protein [Clostridia bacterium]